MNKYQRIAYVIAVFSIILLSCKRTDTKSSRTNEQVETDTVFYDEIVKDSNDDGSNIWYRYKVNGLEGILDKNKKILIEAKYDIVYYENILEKFYAVQDKNIEILNVDGTVFIPISRKYDYINKEDLGNGNNRYYYLVCHKGLYGICDKNGKEILAPRFSHLEYMDNLEDTRFHGDDTNPIGKYGSFFTEDNNKNSYIFDIYIDNDGLCSKLTGKRWTRYYSCSEVMNMDDASCFPSSHKSIFRFYGNYLMQGYEKYHIVNEYTGNESQSLLAEIVNEDGGGYEVDEDIHTFTDHKYMREWKKQGNASMTDFYGQSKKEENTSSYSNNQEFYGGNVVNNNMPNVNIERTTRRPCRLCKMTGDCNICNGSRFDKNKRVYNHNLGCSEPDYGKCRTCGGSGKCISSKGDGWLDEGVDY